MVWHIFKKDWKLLSRLVLGLAAAQCLYTMLLYKRDHGATDLGRPLEPPANDHAAGQRHTCCGSVHVDAIPGVRQDWLVGQSREETYWPPSYSL